MSGAWRWMGTRTGLAAAVAAAGLAGCRSTEAHRRAADGVAVSTVERLWPEATGREEPFTIERPADLLRERLGLEPAEDASAAPLPEGTTLRLSLEDALRIGAAHSREYQSRKEDVFRAALQWDIERDALRGTVSGTLTATGTEDRTGEETVRGTEYGAEGRAGWLLRSGAELSTRIAVDLVQLLTLDRDRALGLLADASITLPLLRGAGRAVVTEPITQAERNVVYAIQDFDQFRRAYAVRVATEYLGVLERAQLIRNAEENVRRLEAAERRAEQLAAAGRLPEIQLDQVRQDRLRAEDRLSSARQAFERQRDGFTLILGVPSALTLELDPAELDRLEARIGVQLDGAAEEAPALPDLEGAVALAFEHRLDLRKAEGEREDAQRRVAVAENALRSNLALEAGGTAGEARGLGSAGRGDAELDPGRGRYRLRLRLDLPWRKTRERAAYRNSLIAAERAERALVETVDRIRVDVADALRSVRRAEEGYRIQGHAVAIAARRVESTEMFIRAGRAQVRDLLDAQEALVSAQNARVGALVQYRTAWLNLQRELGVLTVSGEGQWHEYAFDGQ